MEAMEAARGLVAEFQAADWQAWRHHPVTRVLLRYLQDRRDQLYWQVFDRFVAGTFDGGLDREERGAFLAFEELMHLEWAGLCFWYGIEEGRDA